MSDLISFSANHFPGHENVRDIELRDKIRSFLPDLCAPVTSVTLMDGSNKIEVERENLPGYRPTLYVDIHETLNPDDRSGVFRSLTVDEETGYVTDCDLDVFGPKPAKTAQVRHLEMDFMAAVTKDRVDDIKDFLGSFAV